MNKNIWALLIVSALTANVYAANPYSDIPREGDGDPASESEWAPNAGDDVLRPAGAAALARSRRGYVDSSAGVGGAASGPPAGQYGAGAQANDSQAHHSAAPTDSTHADQQGAASGPASGQHDPDARKNTWIDSFANAWSLIWPSRMSQDKVERVFQALSDSKYTQPTSGEYRNATANFEGRFKTVAGRALKVIGAWTLVRSVKSGVYSLLNDDEDDEEEDY